jgi:hypothetical protein
MFSSWSDKPCEPIIVHLLEHGACDDLCDGFTDIITRRILIFNMEEWMQEMQVHGFMKHGKPADGL